MQAAAITTFDCVGCRQQIRVCDPDSGAITLQCPIENCRRVIWALPQSEPGGVLLGTNQPPQLLAGRFAVDQYRLLIDGAELLAGPGDLMAEFARELDDLAMFDHEIPAWIRAQIQRRGRGCAFTPGPELIRLGRMAREGGYL